MGRLCGPPLLSEPHLMSIRMYMLLKCVFTVHVRTLLSSCEALMHVSSKLGASISSTPSSRRLSMGKNTLEGEGKGKGGREEDTSHSWSVMKSTDTILGYTTLPHTPPLFHTSPPPSHIPHTPSTIYTHSSTHQCTLLPSHIPPPSPGRILTSRKQASHSLGDSLCRSWASRALCR